MEEAILKFTPVPEACCFCPLSYDAAAEYIFADARWRCVGIRADLNGDIDKSDYHKKRADFCPLEIRRRKE